MVNFLTDITYILYYRIWKYTVNIFKGIFFRLFNKEYRKRYKGTITETNRNQNSLTILGDDGIEYQVLVNTYFIYLKNFNIDVTEGFHVNDRVTFNKTHIKEQITVYQQILGIKPQVINVEKIDEKDDVVETFEGEIDFIEQYSETKRLKEYVAFRFFINGEEKIISLDYNQTVFKLKIDDDLSDAKYGDKVIAKINTKNMMILDIKFKK